ncbi:MAG: amidohydrolase family protein [Acidimicrobiia bacterium]|nr:amidohydrolase family protein [Acidimicrobiia bacterium]
MPSTLLVENLSVIATMDDEGRELRNQSILIEDKAIAEIGPDLAAPPDARVIDGSGKVALPGFVNTHHHLWQTYCRDLPRTVNALDLFDWLVVKYGIWQEIDPELVYHASLVGLGMLLKTGCTLSSDNHVAFPRDKGGEIIDAGIRAAQDLGIRFHPARGAVSQPGPFVPDVLVQSDDEVLADYERLVNAYHDPSPFSMVRIALGPTYLPTTTKNLMEETVRYARENGLYCHSHLAEGGELEEAWTLEHYGMRPFDVMESLGWMGPDIWFAHCIYLNDDEIRRMGEYGTGLAHCPVCNSRLSRRVAPILQMMDAGVKVGFGVDGAEGYGDIIAELQTANVLHRFMQGRIPLARKMLRIASKGGAEVLGWDSLGSIEPGKAADIALIDTNQLDYGGITHDPVSSIVLFGANHIVDTTICNGEVVVENGRLTRVDETEIVARANELSRQYLARASARTGVDYSQPPPVST